MDNNEDADFKEVLYAFLIAKTSIRSCLDICVIPTTMIIIDLLSVHLYSHYSTLDV